MGFMLLAIVGYTYTCVHRTQSRFSSLLITVVLITTIRYRGLVPTPPPPPVALGAAPNVGFFIVLQWVVRGLGRPSHYQVGYSPNSVCRGPAV